MEMAKASSTILASSSDIGLPDSPLILALGLLLFNPDSIRRRTASPWLMCCSSAKRLTPSSSFFGSGSKLIFRLQLSYYGLGRDCCSADSDSSSPAWRDAEATLRMPDDAGWRRLQPLRDSDDGLGFINVMLRWN